MKERKAEREKREKREKAKTQGEEESTDVFFIQIYYDGDGLGGGGQTSQRQPVISRSQ